MTRPEQSSRREPGESVRSLSDAAPSKVGVDKAMRARDVSRVRAGDGAPEPPQPAGDAGSAGSSSDAS